MTTLDELTSAVTGDDPKIVIISGTSKALIHVHMTDPGFQGTITGDDVVKVGPNTTVLGEPGASKYLILLPRNHF